MVSDVQYDTTKEALVSGMPLQDAYDLLEARRNNVQEYLVFLRRLRNDYLPISRIPPEVLVEIFQHVKNDDDYGLPFWKSLACVCHDWRVLALSVSALWCDITLDELDKSRVFLERCRAGPVHITQSCSNRNGVAIPLAEIEQQWQEVLDPHTSRFHSIDLYGSEATSLWSALQCLRGPFSELRTLSLSSGAASRLPWKEPADDFFPVLRQLKLYRVTIPWTSPVFRNLVSLTLHDQLVGKPTMPVFVGVLQQCASTLEHLSIAFGGPRYPQTAAELTITEPVHLSQLQTFRLHHHGMVVSWLLQHVSFPRSTQLSMEYKVMVGGPLDWGIPVDTSLFKHLTNISSFRYRTDRDSIQVDSENLNLKISLDHDDDLLEELNPGSVFLSGFISRISPLDGVRRMTVICEDYDCMGIDEWRATLQQLPSLQRLSYCHYQQYPDQGLELCDALSEVNADGKLFCPNLQCLVLSDINFTIPTLDSGDSSNEQDVGIELAHSLQARSEMGNRLKELKIRDAFGLKDWSVDLLEEWVDDLEWNSYVKAPQPWDDTEPDFRTLCPDSDLSTSSP